MPNVTKMPLAVLGATLLSTACIPAPAPTPADKTAPMLAQVAAVPNGSDTTPDFSFSSSEAGSISYSGSCSAATASAVAGNNTITFSTLAYGSYSNCSITVTDSAGNASAALAVNTFTIVRQRLLNDTGVTLCGDYAAGSSGNHNNNIDCATAGSTKTAAGTDGNNDPVPAGQDAVYGRDANPATNDDSDGYKGFSFTKLKADGTALAIQNGTWSEAGSEAAGTKWSCVQDNVTGLIWEIKTADGGLRDRAWLYSWYSSNSSTNGGNAGTADTGPGVGSDNCFNNARCDTEQYVADVNALNFCGEIANDWRVPSADELKTLRHFGVVNPSIDAVFFPNTVNNYYWSSTTYSDNVIVAWIVSFSNGGDSTNTKSGSDYLRLVRGGD